MDNEAHEAELIVGNLETTPPPAEAPETEMAAVFELGATQNEVQHLRREVAECQTEISRLSAVVGDLARIVTELQESLTVVVEEEERIEETIQQEAHASIFERLMGGHHTPTNR